MNTSLKESLLHVIMSLQSYYKVGGVTEKTDGRVGINTKNPTEALQVEGNVALSGDNRFVGTITNNSLSLRTNNIDRITVDTEGNVLPGLNEAYDLGSSILRFKDLYLSGNTIDLGGITIGKTINNDLVVNGSISLLKSRAPPVKRFVEQTAGGRNPYDALVFIDGDDNVRVIGNNNDARFGNTTPVSPAAVMLLPFGKKASKVYAFEGNLFILTEDGIVYASGENAHGQCGLTGRTDSSTIFKPTQTATPVDPVTFTVAPCVKIAHSTGHAGLGNVPYISLVMFLRSDGRVYSAGYNQFGGLGINNTNISNSLSNGPYLTLGPDNPYGNPTAQVIDVIGVGSYNGVHAVNTCCALLNDGTVWCVGYGGNGQMGNGTTTSTNGLWQQVQDASTNTALTNIVKIYGAGFASVTSLYALNANGELYSWGYNGQGQLGLGNTATTTRATKVTLDNNGNAMGQIVDVYAWNSNDVSVIVKTVDGKMWGCGFNGEGNLGIGNGTNQSSFVQITALQGIDIENIYTTGGETRLAVVWAKETGTNRIFVTGKNAYGEAGLHNNSPLTSFTEVPFSVSSPIVDIMPAYTFNVAGGSTMILTADGNTYFAGLSRFGIGTSEGDRNVFAFAKNTYQITGG